MGPKRITISTFGVAFAADVTFAVVVVIALLASWRGWGCRWWGKRLFVLATDWWARMLVRGSWPALDGFHARCTRHLRRREARWLLIWRRHRPHVWLVHSHIAKTRRWSRGLLLGPYATTITKPGAKLRGRKTKDFNKWQKVELPTNNCWAWWQRLVVVVKCMNNNYWKNERHCHYLIVHWLVWWRHVLLITKPPWLSLGVQQRWPWPLVHHWVLILSRWWSRLVHLALPSIKLPLAEIHRKYHLLTKVIGF